MSQNVQNNSDGTKAAQAAMASAVDALRAKIKAVTQAVDAAKSGWQGDAFRACTTAATNWDQEASKLNSILDEITSEVGQGNQAYTGLEGDNVQEFSKLQSDTGSAGAALTSLHIPA
ncbi:WXG100 family type VII secretion target [Nocardia sp. NEAU-G5]|uniref:WXG100 family type VII secretion target n=1 Tax=Nocardia albiluteola TaxID=2842303 RepID=A0ABS6B765_9NOCA|nr:WXG100 family type VII secretion target [Nocardia albiluteola]MBU3065200.1 WXG100 family type VII secretion target [Nocardia albiluteola]